LETRLDALPLPARTRSYLARRGLKTVGDVIALDPKSLPRDKNFGRGSRASLRSAIERVCGTTWEVVRLYGPAIVPEAAVRAAVHDDLNNYETLEALWRAETSALGPKFQKVLHLRSGVDAPAMTLKAIGLALGFTRERARQVETKGLSELLRAPWWVEGLKTRLLQHLQAGAVRLDTLVQHDPWLVSLRDRPDLFAFLNTHFLDGQFHLVTLDAHTLLARTESEGFDTAWRDLDQRLQAMRWPLPRALVDAAIANAAASLGEPGRQWLSARAARFLTLSDDGSQAMGYGSKRAPKLLGWLRTQGNPVPVREVIARFGSREWPDEVVYADYAMVTTAESLKGFAELSEPLVSRCVAHMQAYGPERQWSTLELVAMLTQERTLPAWFGTWPLRSMLQRNPRVRYLGRGVVVLAEVEGDRLQLRALLVATMQAAGKPVTVKNLERLVAERRGLSLHRLTMALLQKPFVETARGLFGLIERDLPGGPDDAARATDFVAEALAQRGEGLSFWNALAQLTAHDSRFAQWTEPALRSVCRQDARFQTTLAGGVGLAAWGSARVPTRQEILREALAAPEGRVLVAEVQQRIAAVYGRASGRALLGLAAAKEGAGLEGPWLVKKDAVAADPSAPPVWEGLPEHFTARWDALHALEKAGAQEDLARAVDAHVQRVYLDAGPRGGVDMAAVLKVRRACHALLARAASCSAPLRALARAAVRHFLHAQTPRSLDDHLALLQAVALRLDPPPIG